MNRKRAMLTTLKACAPPLLIECALIFMARVGLLRGELPWLLPAWCLAFVGLALAWRWRAEVFRRPAAMLAWAVVFRVTLLPCVPDLSDDFYRYLWDGWLTSQGVNPYRFTPDDPALAEFASRFPFDRVNSKQLHSVYPPLTQIVAAGAGAAYGMWGFVPALVVMKAIFVLLELVGVAGLLAATRQMSSPRGKATTIATTHACELTALYAWNPLAILAIAGQGHSEAGLVFGIGVAAWALARARAAMSWVGLALAALAKLTPMLAAPLWWRFWRTRDHAGSRQGIWAGVAVIAVCLAPFWFAGLPANYLSSLRLYVQWFEFNAPVYSAIKGAIVALTGYDSSKQLGPLLALATVMVAWIGWRMPKRGVHDRWPTCGTMEESRDATAVALADVFNHYAIIIGAFLLLATTVHPWYALAALVLTPLSPVLRWGWVWFSFASFATYFAYNAQGGLRERHGSLSVFVWFGFLMVTWKEHGAGIILAVLRRRGQRKAAQIAPHLAGETVLDLGSGEGFVAQALRENEMKHEHSEPAIFLCDVASVNRTALPSVVYDGRRLPFADGSVDTVILSLVLHHCADPVRVLREAARVARLRVVVTESTYENALDRLLISGLDRLVNRLRPVSLRGMETHLHFRTPGAWRELFEAGRLTVVDTRWLCRRIHKHVLFVLEHTGSEDTGAAIAAGR